MKCIFSLLISRLVCHSTLREFWKKLQIHKGDNNRVKIEQAADLACIWSNLVELAAMPSWRIWCTLIKDFGQNVSWISDAFSFILLRSYWKGLQFYLKSSQHTVQYLKWTWNLRQFSAFCFYEIRSNSIIHTLDLSFKL